MPKMSFAQQIDAWEALTGNAAASGDDHPAFAEVLTELVTALNDAKKSRSAHRRLRSKMLVEMKRLREAVARGQDAEKRLRRFLQAVYGPASPQLHRFGLKPRKKRIKRNDSESFDPTDADLLEDAAAGEEPGAPAAGE